MRGKLIVFEGIEGSGKTTQIQHLSRWLEASLTEGNLSRYSTGVIVTRQPGGTCIGQHIRQILLNPSLASEKLTSTSELLLYAADRAQHVEQTLLPGLKAGYLVLCDRYTASTVAYQGYGRQLDLDLINKLNTIATGGLAGDLTLWLKLDVEEGLGRMSARGEADRIEQAGLDFHRRVNQGFEAQAKQQEHFIAVDGSLNQEAVAEQIQAIVSEYLQTWYAF
ncbi:MAG: dTMP kinase [Cyanobacteria bacterium P01_D01_bin.56]